MPRPLPKPANHYLFNESEASLPSPYLKFPGDSSIHLRLWTNFVHKALKQVPTIACTKHSPKPLLTFPHIVLIEF